MDVLAGGVETIRRTDAEFRSLEGLGRASANERRQSLWLLL